MGVIVEGRKVIIDHMDRNPLNNSRSNLRPCTTSQNAMNSPKIKNCTSVYKGVYWDNQYKKWRVTMRIGKKHTHIGRFNDEIEAALAYNTAAEKEHGEFAYLNVIPSQEVV